MSLEFRRQIDRSPSDRLVGIVRLFLSAIWPVFPAPVGRFRELLFRRPGLSPLFFTLRSLGIAGDSSLPGKIASLIAPGMFWVSSLFPSSVVWACPGFGPGEIRCNLFYGHCSGCRKCPWQFDAQIPAWARVDSVGICSTVIVCSCRCCPWQINVQVPAWARGNIAVYCSECRARDRRVCVSGIFPPSRNLGDLAPPPLS